MKRMIASLLALLLVLGLTACGGKAEKNEAPAATEAVSQVPTEEMRQEETQPKTSNAPVTLEALLKAPATSGELFELTGETELWINAYKGTDNMVVIPEEYESLPIISAKSYAFALNSVMEAIRFNNKMTTIAEALCADNVNLKIVVLGDNTQKLEMTSFQQCTALHTVLLNEGLQEIGAMAFFGCTNLKEVTIPATVSSIGSAAFSFCHEDFTIYGTAGSYAETYAAENGIPFVAK